MTDYRQNHHFQPLHENDVKEELKPWRLPFWTEPPAWLVEKKDKEQPEATAAEQEDSTEEELSLPTAEELENIRREAYNDGLEQGLIEGRQQGRKEGYDAGHNEGYETAFSQGEKEGREQGFSSGQEEGLRQGQADINLTVKRLQRIISRLQATLTERDQQLPEVLAALVAGICGQVLGEELKDGAVNIHQFVRRALDELPAGEKNAHVFVGPEDARHLRNSPDGSGDELHFSVDESLPAGSCRVESEHTLVEYSSAEYLNQILERVLPQMMHQAASYPDEQEQVGWDSTDEDNVTATVGADVTAGTPETPKAAAPESGADESGLSEPSPPDITAAGEASRSAATGEAGHEPE